MLSSTSSTSDDEEDKTVLLARWHQPKESSEASSFKVCVSEREEDGVSSRVESSEMI